jgi:hypothetical protein
MDTKVRGYLKNNSQKGYILKRITVALVLHLFILKGGLAQIIFA